MSIAPTPQNDSASDDTNDHLVAVPSKDLIVIHGWGGSYADALAGILRLRNFPVRYQDGAFHLSRRDGMVVRRLLRVDDPDPVVRSFQKLAVARLLASGMHSDQIDDFETATIRETFLYRNFSAFGIPTGPQTRSKRAAQLQEEALAELEPITPLLDELRRITANPDDKLGSSEVALREEALRLATANETEQSIDPVALLNLLRDLHETGGDADTVMSAVFYTYWLRNEAHKNGKAYRYGIEYQYVFVNYHEPFLHLAAYAPADLYMADLPIGALPDFDSQICELRKSGIRLRRFEDHHPFSTEQGIMLRELGKAGKLDFLDMSGPLEGQELADEELLCAADMVHKNCIEGTEIDSPELRHLRTITHGEDFVTDRQPLGILITNLIKGGISKIELAQLLAEKPSDSAFRDEIASRGWERRLEEWEAVFQETAPLLAKNTVEIMVKRPDLPASEGGGPSLGPGSDVPVVTSEAKDVLTILVVNAPPPPKEARIPVGRVVEFVASQRPDVDYLFYCYGSSLMVCRRLNHADLSINLGALMPQLGGPGDGGHGGAAVCRPSDNLAYPTSRLGRVYDDAFPAFANYLAHRLTQLGLTVCEVRNTSVSEHRESLAKSSKKLLYITAAAFLVGILLLLVPGWRPTASLDSNKDFLPQLAQPAEDALEDPQTEESAP